MNFNNSNQENKKIFDNEQTKINDTFNINKHRKQANKSINLRQSSHYLDNNNNNDCLTDIFITIYKSIIWCIQFVYKFFFKFPWQILFFTKEEIHYGHNDNKTINSLDIMSINNSAGENYLSNNNEKIYRKLPRPHLSMIQTKNKRNNQQQCRRRLSKSNSQHLRQVPSSKINMISNKTRITIRSMSNQNINRSQSNHTEKNQSNTLGSINSHIIVVPVRSSHCENMKLKNNLTINPLDLKQSENINLREQLSDALCRRLYEPLTFMNRGMCCGHCRPSFFPPVPFHHSGHYFPPSISQQQSNKEEEFSQKSKQSPQMGDASESRSSPYSASPSIQSHVTESPEDESLSTGTIFQNEPNEQNQSILSFPLHDTPPSQESDQLSHDDRQLKISAKILVDDLIENAQEKYQRIMRMSIEQDSQDIVKQAVKNKSKSVLIFDESNTEKLSNVNTLCQELCNKLNLSDSNQVAEIVRILASNAPHILKQQFANKNPLIDNSNTIKENENILCRQLLLHPPFKPKRLIHLCPDGSIQVLSAVDENSNENQIINQQKYHLNYSNSAITPSLQQNNILKNESSLALEYETTTTTLDLKTNLNHMIFTESTATQQSHSTNEIHFDHLVTDDNSLLSLEPKKTFFNYDSPINKNHRLLPKHTLTLSKERQESNSDHSKTVSHNDDDPIVNINLDLNDETMIINSEDDENSLPEIFFKRIIAPSNSMTPLTEISNQCIMDAKDKSLHIRRKNHQRSRQNHSRSNTNKRRINNER